MSTSALVDAAVRLAVEGRCFVFPCAPGINAPCKGTHGFLDATNDPDEIREMWARYGAECNIGIATGASRLVVVDLDGPTGRACWEHLTTHFPTPKTLTAATPRADGGAHLYFRASARFRVASSTKEVAPGIDIRAERGYVAAPPSRRTAGEYAWLPGPNRLALAPDWLPMWIELQRGRKRAQSPSAFRAPVTLPAHGSGYAAAALRGEVERVVYAEVGTRNRTLRNASWSLGTLVGAGVLEHEIAASALHQAGVTVGLTEREVIRTAGNGLRDGMREPRTLSLRGLS
jgi:hypothetical protein